MVVGGWVGGDSYGGGDGATLAIHITLPSASSASILLSLPLAGFVLSTVISVNTRGEWVAVVMVASTSLARFLITKPTWE